MYNLLVYMKKCWFWDAVLYSDKTILPANCG